MFKLKYVWPYLLFIGSIAALVIANRYNIEQEIGRNLSYTKTLNVSGRQRMLSQKLVKLSYKKAAGENVQQEFTTALNKWQKAHNDLANSQNGVSLYADNHPGIKEKFNELNTPYNALLSSFTQIANNGTTEELLKVINQNEQSFLTQMDAIVTELEQNATLDLQASEKKQSILATLSGFILLLEMIFFVYPYHKRLVSAYKKEKEQQKKLAKQKEQIEDLYGINELIIKGNNAGIWEWNITTGEEKWSDRFYRLLGYEPGEIPALYDTFLNKLLHTDDHDKIQQAVELHLKNKTPYKDEIRMLNKNGTYRWYETSGQAEWNEEGNAIRMAGSIIDITERMSTREKLLSESSTKDQLLSIITHDLRSPINNLKALLTLLKENIISKEEFLQQLQNAAHNVDNLSESMDNILAWAQGQRKGWTVTPSEFKVNDAINECVRLYKNNINEKNITLKYTISDIITAYADFNQIVLIIRNLLNNAIKFTPEHGTISITATQNLNTAQVHISDSGVGMDTETLARVMNVSQMYSTKGTIGEKGTGLGMNMSLEFAAKNHCTLKMESEIGKGTKVTLDIPKTTLN